MVAFTYDTISMPPFDVCTDSASQLMNAPIETSYFKLFPTNLTNVDTYGAIYFR